MFSPHESGALCRVIPDIKIDIKIKEDMPKTTGVHLWLSLIKANQAIEKRAENGIAKTGLTFTDFRILEILAHKGPVPVNTIGARTNLTSGAATTAIDRLQDRGFVERVEHPDDKRSRIVHLTGPGQKVIEKAFSKHAKVMEKAAAGLSSKERSELAGLLKKLSASAKG
jgi:MarR family transcriptional regulator, 2-MHQ and catechol-resistance regulon repressor